MAFRVYEQKRRIAAELRKNYAGKFPFLVLINASYCGKKGELKGELPGLVLAEQAAAEEKCVVVYGLPTTIPQEHSSLLARLRQMPNVRFLNTPDDAKALCQAYNELRAPWLWHAALPNPKANRKKPKTRD